MSNATINDWYPETRDLLDSLVKAGFEIRSGHNGEDAFKFEGDIKKFIENLTACDESNLYVFDPALGRERTLYLIYGNSPGELVSDYGIPREGDAPAGFVDKLDAVTTAHYDKWISRKQPTKIRV